MCALVKVLRDHCDYGAWKISPVLQFKVNLFLNVFISKTVHGNCYSLPVIDQNYRVHSSLLMLVFCVSTQCVCVVCNSTELMPHI